MTNPIEMQLENRTATYTRVGQERKPYRARQRFVPQSSMRSRHLPSDFPDKAVSMLSLQLPVHPDLFQRKSALIQLPYARVGR